MDRSEPLSGSTAPSDYDQPDASETEIYTPGLMPPADLPVIPPFPVELWHKIFDLLPFQNTLKASEVCKRWLIDAWAAKTALNNTSKLTISACSIFYRCTSLRRLEKLDYNGPERFPFLVNSPLVEYVDVDFVYEATLDLLTYLNPSILKTLRLEVTEVHPPLLEALQRFTQLHTLAFYVYDEASEYEEPLPLIYEPLGTPDFNSLPAALVRLESLSISGYIAANRTWPSYEKMAETIIAFPNLKECFFIKASQMDSLLFEVGEVGTDQLVATFGMHPRFYQLARVQDMSLQHYYAATDTQLSRFLVQVCGLDVNSTAHPKRKTPLLLATKHKNAAVVRYLLDAGADVNQADLSGKTPLTQSMLHFYCCDNQAMGTFFDHGARLDTSRVPAAFFALSNGIRNRPTASSAMLQVLYKQHSSLHSIRSEYVGVYYKTPFDLRGLSLLQYAARMKNLDALLLLKSKSPAAEWDSFCQNYDKEGNNGLYYLVKMYPASNDLLDPAITAGAEMFLPNTSGESPYTSMSLMLQPSRLAACIQLWLNAKRTAAPTDGLPFVLPFIPDLLLMACKNNWAGVVDCMMPNLAPWHVCTGQGHLAEAPLSVAIEAGHLKLVGQLLTLTKTRNFEWLAPGVGIKVNASCPTTNLQLHRPAKILPVFAVLCNKGHPQVHLFLPVVLRHIKSSSYRDSFLSTGNALSTTQPPLQCAVAARDVESTRMLLEAGANPNARWFQASSTGAPAYIVSSLFFTLKNATSREYGPINELYRLLIAHGLDLSQVNEQTRNVALIGCLSVVEYSALANTESIISLERYKFAKEVAETTLAVLEAKSLALTLADVEVVLPWAIRMFLDSKRILDLCRIHASLAPAGETPLQSRKSESLLAVASVSWFSWRVLVQRSSRDFDQYVAQVVEMLGKHRVCTPVDFENLIALTWASYSGHISVIKAILAQPTSRLPRDSIRQALCAAAAANQVNAAQILLSFPYASKHLDFSTVPPSCGPLGRLNDVTSPLLLAVTRGHHEMTQFLLEHGASPRYAPSLPTSVAPVDPLSAAYQMRKPNRHIIELLDAYTQKNLALVQSPLPERDQPRPSVEKDPASTPKVSWLDAVPTVSQDPLVENLKADPVERKAKPNLSPWAPTKFTASSPRRATTVDPTLATEFFTAPSNSAAPGPLSPPPDFGTASLAVSSLTELKISPFVFGAPPPSVAKATDASTAPEASSKFVFGSSSPAIRPPASLVFGEASSAFDRATAATTAPEASPPFVFGSSTPPVASPASPPHTSTRFSWNDFKSTTSRSSGLGSSLHASSEVPPQPTPYKLLEREDLDLTLPHKSFAATEPFTFGHSVVSPTAPTTPKVDHPISSPSAAPPSTSPSGDAAKTEFSPFKAPVFAFGAAAAPPPTTLEEFTSGSPSTSRELQQSLFGAPQRDLLAAPTSTGSPTATTPFVFSASTGQTGKFLASAQNSTPGISSPTFDFGAASASSPSTALNETATFVPPKANSDAKAPIFEFGPVPWPSSRLLPFGALSVASPSSTATNSFDFNSLSPAGGPKPASTAAKSPASSITAPPRTPPKSLARSAESTPVVTKSWSPSAVAPVELTIALTGVPVAELIFVSLTPGALRSKLQPGQRFRLNLGFNHIGNQQIPQPGIAGDHARLEVLLHQQQLLFRVKASSATYILSRPDYYEYKPYAAVNLFPIALGREFKVTQSQGLVLGSSIFRLGVTDLAKSILGVYEPPVPPARTFSAFPLANPTAIALRPTSQPLGQPTTGAAPDAEENSGKMKPLWDTQDSTPGIPPLMGKLYTRDYTQPRPLTIQYQSPAPANDEGDSDTPDYDTDSD